MKTIFKTLFSLPIFLATISPAYALHIQKGDNLTLDQKRYDESVVVAGNNIEIKSDINGDLICAGQTVTITGKITGDVLCVGQTISSKGDVDGNFRVAGQTINIDGKVGKNVSVAGQTFTLNDKATVKNDVFFAGQTINLLGFLGRDLTGASESLNISNTTNRNAILAFKTLNLSSTGIIKGNLDYYFEKDNEPKFDSKNIKGTINKHEVIPPARPEVNKEKINAAKQSFVSFGKIVWFIGHILLTLVVVLLFRKSVKSTADYVKSNFWSSMGIGFAVLLLAPVASLILSITVIGLPVAAIAMLLYLIGLLTSGIFVGSALGETILVEHLKQKQLSIVSYTLLGVATILIVSKIVPVLGFFVGLITITTGFGAFCRSIFARPS